MHIHDTYMQPKNSFIQENIIKMKMLFYCVRKKRDAPSKSEATSALILDTSASRNNLFTWLKSEFLTHAMRDPVHKRKSTCTKTINTALRSICKHYEYNIFLSRNMYNAYCLTNIYANVSIILYLGLLFGWLLRYKNKFEYWHSVKHKILVKWKSG